MTVLEAIDEELAMHYRHADCLERAKALIKSAYESAEPRPAPSKHRPSTHSQARRPRKRGRSSRNAFREEVKEYVIAHGPLSLRELIDGLDSNPKTTSEKLKLLLEDGEIGADGPLGARRYRAAEAFKAGATLSAVRRASVSALPARGVYPVYDATVDLKGASNEQLRQRTGLPTSAVVKECQQLVQLGLIQFSQTGSSRVWQPTRSDAAGDVA